MTVVVADTSPIRYLVGIGEIGLLEKLYGQVIVPSAVLAELQAEDGLALVRAWAGQLPDWVRVQTPARPLAAPAAESSSRRESGDCFGGGASSRALADG